MACRAVSEQSELYCMAGEHGFEPWNGGFKGPCLTAWRLPNEEKNERRYPEYSMGSCPELAWPEFDRRVEGLPNVMRMISEE